MSDQERQLTTLIEKIRHDRGFDGSQYKPTFLKRRLAVRMQARNVTSYQEFQKLLDVDPGEYPLLISALTINLSYFFRDGEVFLHTRDDILAPLIQRREAAGRRHLSIWSAGCARGEEPYSLAITLWELLGSQIDQWRLKILATDVDDDVLNKARSGQFTNFGFRGVSEAFLAPFFSVDGSRYYLRPDLRRLVTFQQHDLVNGIPPGSGSFDLILCRNVLIYFTRQHQAQVFDTFHQALRPGGHLILGKTEIPLVSMGRLFRATDPRLHIYARMGQEEP